jgi:adenine-specific DNA-methyltransferase
MDGERMDGLSVDVEATERDKLRAVFPQCFVEGKLDIDRLLNLCGEYITDDFEKYEFRWKGKGEALQLAGKRSFGTLRPCVEESVDWENTGNLYIEGDNLEVLKLLQTSYYRKVKMIYLDPPYNTGNDFVYPDDFTDPLARYREVTQQTTKSNPETMGRFHTNWLNMMWPRLRLAANLLRDDGVIFISIDDNEVRNLKYICDEIFGEENFLAQLIWHSRQNKDNRNISGASIDHEYILCYSKTFGLRIFNGTERKTEQYSNPDNDPRGDWTSANMVGLATADLRPNLHYDLVNPETGVNFGCPAKGWRYNRRTMERLNNENRILWPKTAEGRPRRKVFLSELSDNLPGFSSIIEEGVYTNTATKEIYSLFNEHLFNFPKPVDLIKRLVAQTTEKNDIILDFFSGSATTAHAVMQQNAEDGGNRRFILVQLPELTDEKSEAYKACFKNICEIGKDRIRRVGQRMKASAFKSEYSESITEIDTVPQIGWEDENTNTSTMIMQIEKTGRHTTLNIENLDVGFRVFKLDSSNLKIWDESPLSGENAAAIFEQRLWDYLDVLIPGRTAVEVVYEIMLKLGQDLCAPILEIGLPDNRTVYGVGENVKFIVCLAENISVEDAKIMAEYAPGRIIFAEQCFQNTEQKSNVRLTLRDSGITIKTL